MENNFIVLTLPIYYVQVFKTKNPKTWLVGMNNYRNWYPHFKNQVKQYYHRLVAEQAGRTKIQGQYTLVIEVYLKNKQTDPSNVTALIEKFTLDGLCVYGTTVNDTSNYHIGTTWKFIKTDKENPRCVVTIHPI